MAISYIQLNIAAPRDLVIRPNDAAEDHGISKRQLVIRGLERILQELETPALGQAPTKPVAPMSDQTPKPAIVV